MRTLTSASRAQHGAWPRADAARVCGAGKEGGRRECMTGVQGVLSPFALTVRRGVRCLGRHPDALSAVLRRRIRAPKSRTGSSPLALGCGFGWRAWASELGPALGTLERRAAPAGTPPAFSADLRLSAHRRSPLLPRLAAHGAAFSPVRRGRPGPLHVPRPCPPPRTPPSLTWAGAVLPVCGRNSPPRGVSCLPLP